MSEDEDDEPVSSSEGRERPSIETVRALADDSDDSEDN